MNIGLRAARPEDSNFCWVLYAREAAWIVDTLRLPPQEQYFRDTWKLSEVRIVVYDGNDIGWLQTHSEGDALFVGQIYIAADFQRRGIGTRVMQMLMEDARPVTLTVIKISPAVRFYKRLGFYAEREDAEKLFMRRTPGLAHPIANLRP